MVFSLSSDAAAESFSAGTESRERPAMHRTSPVLFLVAALALAGCRAPRAGDAEAGADLGEVLRLVDENYVRPASRPELVAAARAAMLSALDPYCGYLDPGQYAELQGSLAGALAGVGMRVELDGSQQYRVRAPFRDSPALAA